MKTAADFSDEDLTAYLDGEADETLTRAISETVQNDLALSERLNGLRISEAQIKAAYDVLLHDAPTMPDLPAPVHQRSFAWRELAAGLAVGAFLSAGFTASLRPKEPGWQDFVAAYQALYVTPTLAGVSTTNTDAQAQLTRVSQQLGLDLTRAPEGQKMTFKRAQVLGFEGRDLIQLAFLTDTGVPVALCIIATDTADTKPIQSKQLEGMEAVSWSEDGYGFLLIGGQDSDVILQAAEQFEKVI